MDKHIYPLLFEPLFKDYVWGGRNLERMGRTLPPGIVAESWEIAGHEDGTTLVSNGPYAGWPLTQVQEVLGLELIGKRNAWAQERGKFPLLIKLLDANSPLSVQVHPDDAYALAHEGDELGKTEMWVVLDASAGAELIIGMQPGVTPDRLRQAIAAGNLEAYLHRLPVTAGDAVCVPAGTLHAILGGIIIAEIQQNSNTTYRVYDWNRVGVDGRPRPLHVQQAIEVIDFAKERPGAAEPALVQRSDGLRRWRLCSNRYFTTERVELAQGASFEGECDGQTLEIWGLLSGQAALQGVSLEPVRFILLPAALGRFSVAAGADCVFLRTYVA